MKKIAVLAMVALLLVGCGQKGPLYLPEDPNADEQEG